MREIEETFCVPKPALDDDMESFTFVEKLDVWIPRALREIYIIMLMISALNVIKFILF